MKSFFSIAGDQGLLRQAFLNLLRNAEQAMAEGGELIVRCRQEEGDLGSLAIVEFTDTGVGVPPEQLPRIFRPYFSSKDGGTGLGLPTTLQIVRLHGGDIRVESEPGQGMARKALHNLSRSRRRALRAIDRQVRA